VTLLLTVKAFHFCFKCRNFLGQQLNGGLLGDLLLVGLGREGGYAFGPRLHSLQLGTAFPECSRISRWVFPRHGKFPVLGGNSRQEKGEKVPVSVRNVRGQGLVRHADGVVLYLHCPLDPNVEHVDRLPGFHDEINDGLCCL
jgi:hypothetical protein